MTMAEAAPARAAAFAHVRVWVFDLDNTLYPPTANLFGQIDRRMTAYIAEALSLGPSEANRLREDYWTRYGTTLNGLMAEHKIDADAFLAFVHDIDRGGLTPCDRRRAALETLPGRRWVHTNGSRDHAARTLDSLGVADLFDGVVAIEDSAFQPKPSAAAYAALVAAAELTPAEAAFFEDTARNLAVPHDLGMRTVFTPTGCARAEAERDARYVDFVAEDLTEFLFEVGATGAKGEVTR